MSDRQMVIAGVTVVVVAGVLYLVLRRQAPAPILDDGAVTDDVRASAGGRTVDAAGVVSGIGTGLTGIATSIAGAVQ